ncbi:3-methyladenine DNA glycosylase [Kribbella sp. CA-293567]|uniref:3-methyladenine DNA glycosylase n=1 Tax=Kribbella sp. CA-293567 TaxID=3002436 RepID=UPI0022DD010D|nr:3-methyladenine DNA glycosylase [Kribbella sp. CA-293567]WBQ07578.1 3-methyladenine DNA glycosylase [Kribbella sp. CA-293567]
MTSLPDPAPGKPDSALALPGRATSPSGLVVAQLEPADWEPLQAAHALRVDALLAGHLDRRSRGEKHPVEDFLFTYYPTRPKQLRGWHPGPGLMLRGATQYEGKRGYLYADGVARLDPAEITRRADSITWIARLLKATSTRQPQFGCFGLHEWAMVYKTPDLRHDWPLRLGSTGTDQVVETHKIACSHFDAFRFFTEPARPLNVLQPTREAQPALEQGGCLHANMDLYKWATKLMPFTPSSLLLDCFELARDIRTLDMRASPYDFAALGYEPIEIETPAGKAQYAAAQRAFADRARPLRLHLAGLCDQLLQEA